MAKEAKEIKLHHLEDADGHKLPPNMSAQFRGLQGGVEYLKDAADNITTELKGVSKKLSKNTTDLSSISAKVNEIERRQIEHMNITKDSFDNLHKIMYKIIDVISDMSNKINTKKKK